MWAIKASMQAVTAYGWAVASYALASIDTARDATCTVWTIIGDAWDDAPSVRASHIFYTQCTCAMCPVSFYVKILESFT